MAEVEEQPSSMKHKPYHDGSNAKQHTEGQNKCVTFPISPVCPTGEILWSQVYAHADSSSEYTALNIYEREATGNEFDKWVHSSHPISL